MAVSVCSPEVAVFPGQKKVHYQYPTKGKGLAKHYCGMPKKPMRDDNRRRCSGGREGRGGGDDTGMKPRDLRTTVFALDLEVKQCANKQHMCKVLLF